MLFPLRAVVGAMLATTSVSVVIERDDPNATEAQQVPALNEGDMAIMGSGKFKFCKEINFVNCTEFFAESGQCYFLPVNWDDICSSAQAEKGKNMECYIWSNQSCGGRGAGPVTDNDDFKNLDNFGMDNISSSFRCY